jgi:ParB family transcriptional regulator, chromosome partitioning protein
MTIITRVQTLKIAEIKESKPARSVSALHVKDLVASLASSGFATTVVVRPIVDGGEYKWMVVAGFHRLEAARSGGQAEIHAVIVEDASEIELALIEIDENILRRPLTAAQEARALARRKEIYQQINPAARRGGDRRSANAQPGSLKSFAAATAAATGRSKTAVNRAVARARKITDNALKLVQGSPIESGGFLDRLAKVSPAEQESFVADALAKTSDQPNNQIDVETDLARLRRCWLQSCAEARKEFLAEINAAQGKKTAAGL